MHSKIILSSAMFLLFVGCSSKVEVPKTQAAKNPEKAWGEVLKKYVDKKGRVNFKGVAKDRAKLEMYVAYIAETSPKNKPKEFPTPASKLAYYINAYNALALYNVLHFDIPEHNDSFFRRFKFFYLTKYKIGGEYSSLYAFENDVIRPIGDPRVHVALNCMVRGCPRLPQEPFTAKMLEKQLESQAKEFFNESRNVKVDHKEKKVLLSEILDFFTDDFLLKKPTLIQYVNQYRSKKLPTEYEVDFIDYDWTINSQS